MILHLCDMFYMPYALCPMLYEYYDYAICEQRQRFSCGGLVAISEDVNNIANISQTYREQTKSGR